MLTRRLPVKSVLVSRKLFSCQQIFATRDAVHEMQLHVWKTQRVGFSKRHKSESGEFHEYGNNEIKFWKPTL
jgi:hypothetical protein